MLLHWYLINLVNPDQSVKNWERAYEIIFKPRNLFFKNLISFKSKKLKSRIIIKKSAVKSAKQVLKNRFYDLKSSQRPSGNVGVKSS